MKLSKLTPEQEARLDETKNEYLNIFDSGKDLTLDEIKDDIYWFYEKIMNWKKPIILILDSYLAQKYAANIIFGSQVRNQVRNQVWSQVRNQVWNQVENQVWNQVRNQVRNQVENQVWNQVENQVWSQVRNQVRNQVWNQVRNQVWNQVRNQVWNQVENQVWSQVRNQVWNQVENQVWNQVRNQVRNQVSKEKLEFVWQYLGLSHETYLSFYNYFDKIGILGGESDNFRRYYKMMQKGMYEMMFTEKFVFISKLPLKIIRDDQHRLHSTSQAAIQFRDATSYHYLHGIFFEEDLWKKVTKRKLSIAKVLTISNVDQRRIAINHYGADKVFANLNKKLLDKSDRGNYLYQINEIFPNINVLALRYRDRSTREWYVSFVADIDDYGKQIIRADQAMAWKEQMSEAEYAQMVIEA